MASMSAKCRQKFIAGPDTSGEGAGLLELLSHGLAGGLLRRPAVRIGAAFTLDPALGSR